MKEPITAETARLVQDTERMLANATSMRDKLSGTPDQRGPLTDAIHDLAKLLARLAKSLAHVEADQVGRALARDEKRDADHHD